MTNVTEFRAAETQSDAYRYGYALGVQKVRQRAKAILTAPEAKGRTSLAIALVTDTELSVDEARAVLAKSASVDEPAGAGRPGEVVYAQFARRQATAPAERGLHSRFVRDSESRFEAATPHPPAVTGPGFFVR